MPVAVVVVSWNTRELLARCLESLHPEVLADRARVCVVDNASTDGSAEMVAGRFPWVDLVASPENLGFGSAVNLGARRIPGAWVAPANADVALEPGALESLVATGESDPAAGAIAPRLVKPDGSTQHSLYPFPSVGFTLLFNVGLQRLSHRWADRMCLEGYWDADRARRAPWAIGAFMIIRREAWEQIGGFDEAQWMYAEDLDLGWRLRRAGWVTRYEPAARVQHAVSAATTQAWGEERSARWMRATYAWLQERRGSPVARAVSAINVAGAGAAWLWRVPAARVAPERFARERDAYRTWARLHAAGLRDRAGRSGR